MLAFLDRRLPMGSRIHLLNENSVEFREASLGVSFQPEYTLAAEGALVHHIGRAARIEHLTNNPSLNVNKMNVIVLVTDERHEFDVLLSDSQTIAGSLLIRDVQMSQRKQDQATNSRLHWGYVIIPES